MVTQTDREHFFNKTGSMVPDSEIQKWLTSTNNSTLTVHIEQDTTNTNIEPKHYTDLAISPLEYIEANQAYLPWSIANVIKYVSRYKAKNGIEDLKKAAWYLNHQIELEELLIKESRDKTN